MPRSKTAYPTPTQTAGPSYFATKGSKTPQVISWDQVYALITQDRHVRETTQKARQYRDQGNPQAYAATDILRQEKAAREAATRQLTIETT